MYVRTSEWTEKQKLYTLQYTRMQKHMKSDMYTRMQKHMESDTYNTLHLIQ